MKVSPAAAAPAVSPAGPSCALKGVRLGAGGGAGEPLLPPRCLSEHSQAAAAAASLLMDMKGCYSRLAALVPTLPRHRRVSKVEILQHVIDYIADLQLELQHPLGAAPASPRVAEQPAAAAAGERHSLIDCTYHGFTKEVSRRYSFAPRSFQFERRPGCFS
uniref:DNA-binding protein inhibitor ID-4 n=1 Tax=Salvator merianae TaxID=96440 RepID=A0A8D0E216_SALMN